MIKRPPGLRRGANARSMAVVARLLVSARASTSSAGSASRVMRAAAFEKTMSTSPSSAASVVMAARSRTSSTRPSTRAVDGPSATAEAASSTRPRSRPVSRTRSSGAMRAASPSANARPSPWLAPVMRAIRWVVMSLKVASQSHASNENHAQLICVRRMADLSPTGLRVLREVAQAGSFSAAAQTLGYTQSAVSRQVAALEAAAGRALFERGRQGAVLTPAGARLLPRATRVLDELDAALREMEGAGPAAGPVRLGAFAAAAAGIVPRALASLPREVGVTLREGTTPALTRGLRAGTLDLAIIAQAPPFRPPDAESPPLTLHTLSERELVIGVSARHPFARARAVEVERLEGQVWVASRSDAGESLLGVWPGLAERPDVRYVVRDWLAKLRIVAAGLAITTIAPVSIEALPEDVKTVAVRGEPQESRRIVLARPRGPLGGATAQVADALSAAAARL